MRPADDTIVAISSPPGRSLRGLLRIAGTNTLDIISKLTANNQSPKLRKLTACTITLPTTNHSDQLISLPALLSFFASPSSYTSDDLAELQCPGNPALLDRMLHHCIALGSRLADPGEFTFRAFIASKLDLTEAEGVAATISATSDSQLAAAALLRNGKLSSFSTTLADKLANNLALVESGIDFTDQEDVIPITAAALGENLDKLVADLSHLLSHSRSWGSIQALPRVVLVGAPSSGKSTLFNALLGQHRAVISHLPGTTRDILSQPLILSSQSNQPIEVTLIDIAGLDSPDSALDCDIQAAARNAISHADLIIHTIAADQPAHQTADDLDKLAQPSTPILLVQTKSDLTTTPHTSPSIQHHEQTSQNRVPRTAKPSEVVRADLHATPVPHLYPHDIAVCAQNNNNLDKLKSIIAQHVGNRAVSISSQMLALQPRHEHALRSAAEHLEKTRQLLDTQPDQNTLDDVELLAQSLRQSLDDLASLAGKMTPDDILGRIFANFCIGK